MQEAERHLAATSSSALLGAAESLWSWLDGGGTRPPIRAALIRHWRKRNLLRAPVPLTGPRALNADAPEGHADWVCCFLQALAAEALDYHQVLRDLERGWLVARAAAAGRRSMSRAGLAIDVLAAAPLLSATTLARAIGMSIKSATELLDGFLAEGIVAELTHRSARRLFGLTGMAPVREVAQPPRRPEPGRGRGRPRLPLDDEVLDLSPLLLPPVTRFERPTIDYGVLEAAMAHCDQVIRSARRSLSSLAPGRPLDTPESIPSQTGDPEREPAFCPIQPNPSSL